MISVPKEWAISNRIPPNYSSRETIELSYACAKDVIARNVPGVFVECGVGAGNNFAAMCAAGREGFGFDSFEGIPWAGPNDTEQPGIGAKDKSKEGILESSGVTVHTYENVMIDLNKWNIHNAVLIAGWFQNTVANFDKPIAVLRLDGDLFESIWVCLNYLYPKLSSGGILILDDWQLYGCRLAFKNYFSDRVKPTLIYGEDSDDYQMPTYWIK